MDKTVLVIDDDADLRAVYGKALSGAGYCVLEASQGAEGVHLARTRRPRLIVLDLRMPIMSGWDAIRYLRTYSETKRIPVCVVSSFQPDVEELERLREEIGDEPFDCVLQKPFEPADLVALVEARIGLPL